MRSTLGPEIAGSITLWSGSRGLARSPTRRFARTDFFAASRALHNGCGDGFVIPGHGDPGHDVDDEENAGAKRHDEPQYSHQRHVHAEVTRKTGAHAGNLFVVHRAA